ncbi:unnamed protein product [Rotaria sp. Silwood2]|nr:unnamed protein product [Rotaria sp. Silwood2]CAF4175360.1 unnamed protein product [Rotaria sp. Silwood2]
MVNNMQIFAFLFLVTIVARTSLAWSNHFSERNDVRRRISLSRLSQTFNNKRTSETCNVACIDDYFEFKPTDVDYNDRFNVIAYYLDETFNEFCSCCDTTDLSTCVTRLKATARNSRR